MKYIKLTQGKTTIVDDEDFDDLNKIKWQSHHGGYAIHNFTKNNKQDAFFMHRYILKPEKGQQIDHINGNKLDNRRSNLRIATALQNSWNKKKIKGTSSKYIGVYLNKSEKRWQANLKINKKTIYLGRFDTEKEAAIAYDSKVRILRGEFAVLNFP